jgi:CubicO group peptidase (beta-lactamase class C family)
LALLAWALAAPVAPAEPSLPATELDAWIGGQMARSGIPGYALTVVSSNGVLLERGRGEAAPGRPVTVDTPFVIGSTSKSFTALAVMQLVDAGAVDLDAPVQRYVPEFTMAENAASGVTVRHLLQQTSGIPGAAGGPTLKSARDGSAEEAVAELRDTALAGPPGGEFRYANANFVLAGLVVERVSGQPYAHYVQRHIFDPLQMRHSYTSVADAAAAGLADGHRFWFGVPLRSGPTVRPGLLAAGYLISSVSDLGRYLSMYLQDGRAPDGRQVVSSASLRTMLTPGPQATLGPWADGTRAHYAMGWFVGGPWTESALVHPGNAPDSSAMIVLLPERGWAVAAVTNATHELPAAPPVVDRISRNAVDIVVGDKPVAAGSLRTFYAVFDLGALLLLAGAGWSLARAMRMVRRGGRPRFRPSILAIAGSLLGAALLLQLPVAVGYGWGAAWVWLPDLTLVVGLLVLVLAGNALVRGFALWYWRRRPAPI